MDPIWLLAVAGLIGIIIIVVIAMDNRNKRKQGVSAVGGDGLDQSTAPVSRAARDSGEGDNSGIAAGGILSATAASVAGAGLFDLSGGDDGGSDD